MKIYYKWLALFVAATFIISSCSSKHFATSKEPIKAEVLSDETYEELKDPEITNPDDEPPITSLAITDASQRYPFDPAYLDKFSALAYRRILFVCLQYSFPTNGIGG